MAPDHFSQVPSGTASVSVFINLSSAPGDLRRFCETLLPDCATCKTNHCVFATVHAGIRREYRHFTTNRHYNALMYATVILPLLLYFLRPGADTFVAAGPAPTPLAANLEGVGTGFTPRPTQPPNIGLRGTALSLQHANAPLDKRQAEDGLCGYESGIQRIPLDQSFPCAPFYISPGVLSSLPIPVRHSRLRAIAASSLLACLSSCAIAMRYSPLQFSVFLFLSTQNQ